MDPAQEKTSRRKPPPWLWQVFGYALSAACLAWVLHGYDYRELSAAFKTLDWRWMTLAILLDLSVYLVHAWRWNTLLSPVARLPFWRTVQSIYIGLFANEVLPLRTGEIIRCYLMAHWNDILLSLVFASAAIERLIDGFWMVGSFLGTAAKSPTKMPTVMMDLVKVSAVLLVLGALLLAWVIAHKQKAHALARESRWASTLRHLVDGLHCMGDLRMFTRTIAISALYLLIQMISVWALMRAYGLDLSFWAAAAVLAYVRFATVIPNAPGNLGTFQAAVVKALELFELERGDAKTFSFIMFIALTLPLLIGGAVATALSGLNLKEIRHRARKSAAAARNVAPDEAL